MVGWQEAWFRIMRAFYNRNKRMRACLNKMGKKKFFSFLEALFFPVTDLENKKYANRKTTELWLWKFFSIKKNDGGILATRISFLKKK